MTSIIAVCVLAVKLSTALRNRPLRSESVAASVRIASRCFDDGNEPASTTSLNSGAHPASISAIASSRAFVSFPSSSLMRLKCRTAQTFLTHVTKDRPVSLSEAVILARRSSPEAKLRR